MKKQERNIPTDQMDPQMNDNLSNTDASNETAATLSKPRVPGWLRTVLPAAVVGLIVGGVVTHYALPAAGATKAVASVNGQNVTVQDVYDLLIRSTPGPVAVQQLITQKLIMEEAAHRNITVSNADVDAAINKVKAAFPSDAAFQQALQGQNLTEASYRTQMFAQVALQKILGPSIKITQAQEQKYYNDNKDSLATQAPEVKASHILVNTQQEATAIKKQLDAGADFATLAKQKSLDTGSKDQGGELGYFKKGVMDPNFEKTAFSLKVGQVSDPVQSQFGWHIIKVEAIKPAQYPTFAQAKSKIHDILVNQAVNTQAPSLLTKLKAAAKINMYLPADAAKLPTNPTQPSTTQ